jgi:hypothetical protein
MPILADAIAGPVVVLLGLAAFGLLVLLIALVEAVVLWLLKWGGLWQALRDAFLMNVVSALVGFVLNLFAGDWDAISPLVPLLVAWLLSVLVEGAVLMLLRRHPPRLTWLAAVAANVASYAIIGLLMITGVANA